VAYRAPRTPFYASSGVLGLIDLKVAFSEQGEDLTGDVAFEAANGLKLGVVFGDASGDKALVRALVRKRTIARIRRAYFAQGKTIKAICRDLRVSRKVVRKVIRSGATAFEYERRAQPQPKLGAWRGELDQLLAANAARPTRERPMLMRLFEERRGRLRRRSPLCRALAA